MTLKTLAAKAVLKAVIYKAHNKAFCLCATPKCLAYASKLGLYDAKIRRLPIPLHMKGNGRIPRKTNSKFYFRVSQKNSQSHLHANQKPGMERSQHFKTTTDRTDSAN